MTPPNQPAAAPAPFDMNAILAAFAQMAQAQGAQRLQGQQQQLQAMNPLGDVARSNSRPQGLTQQSSWESMFPTRPSGAGFTGGMSYSPPSMDFAQGARDASQQHPYAQMLGSIPAQNPFIGMPDLINPPRAQAVSQKPSRSPRAYRPVAF